MIYGINWHFFFHNKKIQYKKGKRNPFVYNKFILIELFSIFYDKEIKSFFALIYFMKKKIRI